MKRLMTALTLSALSCAACVQEFPGPSVYKCPDFDNFKPVSTVLEKRCGTIDCHGNIARPLKIYGKRGQRLFTLEEYVDDSLAEKNGTVPGGKDTTDDEYRANWRSVCGLEPELMTRVVDGSATGLELLLLRKPLQIERHKGGPLFIRNDAAYNCIASWLEGALSISECELAAKEL